MTWFFSRRCAVTTSEPISSRLPATSCEMYWPWWTTNFRVRSGIRMHALQAQVVRFAMFRWRRWNAK